MKVNPDRSNSIFDWNSASVLMLFLFFIITSLRGQVLQLNQVNPTGMAVCLGSADFQLELINNDLNDALQNVSISIQLPTGITYVTGSIDNASESDLSNLNQPIFECEAIQPGQALTISYAAKASCEIIPALKNNQAVTNHIQISFQLGEGPFQVEQAAPLSYNLLFAELNLLVNNPLEATPLMIGSHYSPFSPNHRSGIIENEGTAAADTLRIRITPEAEVHMNGFYTFDGQTEIPFTQEANSYVLTFAGAILQSAITEVVQNDHLFQPGEKIGFSEDFNVLSCAASDSTGSVYLLSWGCNDSHCDENDNNAQASSNISVSPFEPSLKLEAAVLPMTQLVNYCGDDAYLEFLYINEGLAPGGWAKNVELYVSYGPTDIVYLSDFSINGVPVSNGFHGLQIRDTLITDRCESSVNFIPSYSFNFSQVDSVLGHMGNIGDDAFFDDLAPGDSICIRYKVHLADSMDFFNLCNDPTYRSLTMGLPKAHYESQCGEHYCVPETNLPAYTASMYGGSNQTHGPSDLTENIPETFQFCSTGWDTRNEILKCEVDEFALNVFLPPAYRLAGSGSASWIAAFSGDTVGLQATQNGNTVHVQGGGHDPLFPGNYFYWNGCYQLELELVCDTALEAASTITWEMNYQCDDCSAIQQRACGALEIQNHYTCGSGQCLGIETEFFQLNRNSFGWTDFTKSTFVTAQTPNINLKAAYPGDSLIAKMTGQIQTIGFTQVIAEISYDGPATQLELLDGTFWIYNQSGILQSFCANVSGNLFQQGDHNSLRYSLTCPPVFSIGDSVVFEGNLKVGTAGLLNDQYIPGLQAQLYVLENNQEFRCSSWAENFTVFEPKTSFYNYYSGTTTCEVRTVKLMVNQNLAHESEDFPNEYRSAYRLKDTVRIFLPEGFDLLSNALTAYYYTTTNGLNAELSLDHTVSVPLHAMDGDTLIFIAQWPANDRVKQNVPVFSFDLQPNCLARDESLLAIDYNWIYRDYSADNTIKQIVYGKMDHMTNPLFDGFNELEIQYDEPNLSSQVISAVTQEGFEREVSYTLELCNQSSTENPSPGTASNVWLDFDQLAENSGVLQVQEVLELPGNSSMNLTAYEQDGNASFFAKLGTVEAGQCRSFEVKVQYHNCLQNDLDSIRVLTGWACSAYPTAIDAENEACLLQTDYLALRYKAADLAWVLNLPDSTYEVGESIPYEVNLISTAPAFLYDLHVAMSLPQQVQINGSQYLYPLNSGIWRDLPPGFDWDLSSLIPELLAHDHGLYGTQESDSNKVRIRFQLTADCGIQAEQRMNFNASGISNCGDSIRLHFENILPLSGFESLDSLAISLQVPDTLVSFEEAVVSVTVTNLGNVDADPADRLELVLPPGITYLSGLNNPDLSSEPDGNYLSGTINPAPAANSSRTIDIQVSVGQVDTNALCQIRARVYVTHNAPFENSPCQTTYVLATSEDSARAIQAGSNASFCIALQGSDKFCSGESVCMTVPDSGNQIQDIDWYKDGMFIASALSFCASESGMYSAQIHHANGIVAACSTISLTEVLTPHVDLPDTLYLCSEGQELTLHSENENFSHLWTYNGLPIGQESSLTLHSDGLYQVMINAGERCFATDSVRVLMRYREPDLISSDYTICGNQPFSLATGCDPSFTYSWQKQQVGTANWFTLQGAGDTCMVDLHGSTALSSPTTNFRVLIQDQLSSCHYEIMVTVTKLPIPCKKVKLYPNPSTDFHVLFQLELEEQTWETKVEVYGLTGELLKTVSFRAGSEKLDLDLSGFAIGTYFARIVTDEGVIANEHFTLAE